MTISITFKGVRLTIEYGYEPAQIQTMNDPGFDESFEVKEVYTAHGDYITDLFDDTSEVEEAISEAHHDRYADEY